MLTNNQGMQLPTVGIIIPCYNHGKYVKECIYSVAKQDYPNKIIFISDEMSQDNSWEEIKSVMSDIENPIVLASGIYQGSVLGTPIVYSQNQKPNGPSSARNRLISMAANNVSFFGMLDADDYYLPGKITKSMDVFLSDREENVGLVYSDANIYREKEDIFIREYREPYSRRRLEQECIISNTPIIRKKALEVNGLYDETMRTAEDWNLWLRITTNFVAFHIPEALHVYRVTGKNASDVVSKEIWQQNWAKIYNQIHGKRN